jgi:hypothetical protein
LREEKEVVKKKGLFNKNHLIIISSFLIIMNVFSTSGYDFNFNNYYSKNIEQRIQQEKYAYGFSAYSGPEVIVKLKLNDPGMLEEIDLIIPMSGILCGTFTTFGKWLICDGNGTLWEINFCDSPIIIECIGGGGVTLCGLSYNPVNNRLFGSSVSGNGLYEIDKNTGNQTYIGSFGDYLMGGIAFDENGTLYGWDVVTDSLYKINSETCEVTLVGSFGININYASGGHFDFDTDTLYLSVYTSTGQLYQCDKNTGQCTLIGNFPGFAQIAALSIPYHYDFCPPYTTISLDPPEPDGENGWYVSDVNVSLSATDELSGVREIRYRTVEGEWKVQSGDYVELFLDYDCLNDGLIKYYAVDFAGTREKTNTFEIDIDQQPPEIKYNVTVVIEGLIYKIYVVKISTLYFDNCSGIERIEFYINDELQETITGTGPEYVWTFRYNKKIPKLFYKIRIYDEAGHHSDIIINSSDIHTKSRINYFSQYSSNVLFRWFFNRFALIDRLLNPIKTN